MTPTATTAARWTGWHRPSKRTAWVKLVEAADYQDCWGLLLDATSTRPGGESVVVGSGVDPNRGASRQRRPTT
jgi:hypothetical protein